MNATRQQIESIERLAEALGAESGPEWLRERLGNRALDMHDARILRRALVQCRTIGDVDAYLPGGWL